MTAPLTFVDSNILVYANDADAGTKQDEARKRLAELWRTGAGLLSVQVLQETYVNVTQKLAQPVSPAAARSLILAYKAWPTHAPDADALLRASEVAERHRIAFWDALIVVSASAMGAQVLLTEDLTHGQTIEGVRVVDPFREDPGRAPVSG